MAIDDLWYRNAILYCLDVEKFQDSDGDGIGDLEGLARRLDYLAALGVTCVWLQPFYPSPNRDNGYDVSDYYGVSPRHGSLGHFAELMSHARALGIRVILDLVVSHTSIDHPWFQSARASPRSPHRDWYVWSKERPKDHAEGIVFPGPQKTTWTLDRRARQYYFHRFYDHQADLDTHNPAVRAEIQRIMGFWLQMGVSGFRMDAVPFLVEKKGANVEHQQDFGLLRQMRDFLQWRSADAILLAEANVLPEESVKYFGDDGDRLQMMLNFPVNQRLFLALATGDVAPLAWALEQTRLRPTHAQWVQFLRSHDELDLGRLAEDERQQVFAAFAPQRRMQLYDRGIRRRLAAMLGGDRRRLELAFSLLFSLPGTPMMQYGDEIGMGDDLRLPERECARTPMQWSDARHGGFSTARKTVRPTISDPVFGYRTINVAAQRNDPGSLLNATARLIRARKECPEIGWGTYEVLRTDQPGVLALRFDWRGTSVLTLHNLRKEPCKVTFLPRPDGARRGDELLVDLFGKKGSRVLADGRHRVALEGWGWRWMRTGGIDDTLRRRSIGPSGSVHE